MRSTEKQDSLLAADYLGCISANLNCTVGFLEKASADPRVIQRVCDLAIEAGNLAAAVRSEVGAAAEITQ